MQVTSLSLTNFRNIASQRVSFGGGVNILYGKNASGKTNLLEALFTLCLARSQRGAPDTLLLQRGCDVYRLEGVIRTGGRAHTLAVAFQRGARKKVVLDGVQVGVRELYGQFCAVAAGPEDSDILSGPPAVRRGFLDVYLSQYEQAYLESLARYQRVLIQRNAALKNEMDSLPFDSQLVSYGTGVMLSRNRFVDTLRSLTVKYHADISGGESLNVAYRPSVPLDRQQAGSGQIAAAFRQKLDDCAARERVMRTSLVGPHRDDIDFSIDNCPARSHGSQGQWRTAAISLKLAVYHMLKDRRGMAPLLLFDEIFAELDEARVGALAGAFEGFSQLFLTTAQQPPRKLREGGCCFRVTGGRVEEIP